MCSFVDRADMVDALRRGLVRSVYEGEDGRILLSEDGKFLMSDMQSGESLCEKIQELSLMPELFTLKSNDASRAVIERFSLHGGEYCTQWVYEKDTPPLPVTADIRPLPQEYIDLAAAAYHDENGYIRSRVEKHAVYGLFEGSALAGFAGFHGEGSMGMLEIFPAYRRRGYAMQLEAFLIGTALAEGRIPYCHVIDGNEASLHLQRKMGLICASLPAIWAG